MGGSLSLFDVPTMFNRRIQKRTTERETYVPGRLPVHTLCEYEPKSSLFFEDQMLNWSGFESICSAIWNEYITRTDTDNNPYLKNEDDSYIARCASGLGNIAK